MFRFELAGEEGQLDEYKVVNRKGRLLSEFEAWGERSAWLFENDCREMMNWHRLSWEDWREYYWPSMSQWRSAWPQSAWTKASRSQWVTTLLFDYLEGRKGH